MFEVQGRPGCPRKVHLLMEALVAAVWLAAIVVVHAMVTPRHQGFHCDDVSIKYPYEASTVSNEAVITVTLVLPAVIMTVVEAGRCLCQVHRADGRQRQTGLWAAVGAFLTYFFGYELLTMALLLLKLSTGQLRPHFLALCRPDVNLTACHGYVSDYNCTNTEVERSLLESARKSFPSGHAANSLFMALFMVLYLELRLALRHHSLLRLTLYAVLTSYALWVSATRVSDHMHHVTDVLAGGMLGCLVAVVTFYRGARGCYPMPDAPGVTSHMEEGIASNGNNSASKAAGRGEEGRRGGGGGGEWGPETPGSPGSPTPSSSPACSLRPLAVVTAPSSWGGSNTISGHLACTDRDNVMTFSLH